jgi:hypothetical protein
MMIEKDWKTKAGLRAICVLRNGYRCGYVGVPEGHFLHGMNYRDRIENPSERIKTLLANTSTSKRNRVSLFLAASDPTTLTHPSLDIIFNVHGSLTFAEGSIPIDGKEIGDSEWWFGFDCNHASDRSEREREENFDFIGLLFDAFEYVLGESCENPEKKTQEYVEKECESLAAQIEFLFGKGSDYDNKITQNL